MTVPQPFQYQGSKRSLAPLILNYLPGKYRRLVEPFAGSAAMSLAFAARARAERYWINDLNKPLAELLNLMIHRPEELADSYAELWKGEAHDALEHFYTVREKFNRTQDPPAFPLSLGPVHQGSRSIQQRRHVQPKPRQASAGHPAGDDASEHHGGLDVAEGQDDGDIHKHPTGNGHEGLSEEFGCVDVGVCHSTGA